VDIKVTMITDRLIGTVRSEMYKRGMKHKEMADLLGISGAYWSDILLKRRNTESAEKHFNHAMVILNIKNERG